MTEKLENLNPSRPAEQADVRHIAADNQVGATAGKATASQTENLVQNKTLPALDLTGLESPKAAPMATAERTDSAQNQSKLEKQDVLSIEDKQAIHNAKASGNANIKYDDAFYSNVKKGSGSLPEFDQNKYEHAGQTTRGLSNSDAHNTVNTSATINRPTDSTAARPTDATTTQPTDGSAARPTDASAAQPANLHNAARLTTNPDGSADTVVKPGDNLWRIAREALKHNKPEDYKPSDREVQDAVRRIAQENHLRNPNLIHPNDKIHIPKDLITIPPEVRRGPEVPVEVRNASPEFAAEVKRQFDTLPENVRRLLAETGNKIVVGGKISDTDPDLRGVTPRGWPPGTTWDDDDGLFNPSRKEITVAETHHNRDTGAFDRNNRVEGSIKHESGHAVDLALGSMSHSDDFKQAYDADVARMSQADKERFSYLLQGGHAGHEETFAEVFGGMHGSSANNSETEAIMRDFPSVRALIQRRLAQLP